MLAHYRAQLPLRWSNSCLRVQLFNQWFDDFCSGDRAAGVGSDGPPNMDLTPDGEHFVIFDRPVGLPQPETHVTLLLNFFDELRRRAPEGN